jgi:hypothetical protein
MSYSVEVQQTSFSSVPFVLACSTNPALLTAALFLKMVAWLSGLQWLASFEVYTGRNLRINLRSSCHASGEMLSQKDYLSARHPLLDSMKQQCAREQRKENLQVVKRIASTFDPGFQHECGNAGVKG